MKQNISFIDFCRTGNLFLKWQCPYYFLVFSPCQQTFLIGYISLSICKIYNVLFFASDQLFIFFYACYNIFQFDEIFRYLVQVVAFFVLSTTDLSNSLFITSCLFIGFFYEKDLVPLTKIKNSIFHNKTEMRNNTGKHEQLLIIKNHFTLLFKRPHHFKYFLCSMLHQTLFQ